MNRHFCVALVLSATTLAGCSSSRIATREAINISVRAMPAYDRERNVEFGGQAVAGQLKLLEGLLESAPDDPDLLLVLARSYSRYAYGYVQLKIECAKYTGHIREQERWADQARDFYTRARGYGTRLLELASPDFGTALTAHRKNLNSELESIQQVSAPGLFWTAFAWGNELAFQPVTPQMLADLGKAALLMHRVVELDERVAAGSAHLFLGSYYGSLSPMLGGDRDRADEHFRRARKAGSEHYLPARLVRADYAWHATGDIDSYVRELNRILSATGGSDSAHNLDNAVARQKATIRLADLDSAAVCDCPGVGFGHLP